MASGSHGTMHWNELMTNDVEKAKRFYSETIGWIFEAMRMPEGNYWVAKIGDDYVCGFFPMQGADFAGVPDHWMPYVAVDDIDSILPQAQRAGAVICREPFDVPGVGRIAILKEPGGAMVGWMTPSES